MSAITPIPLDPIDAHAVRCGARAFVLAISRDYCVTVARSLARKAHEAARRCTWKTPDQIARDVVPGKAMSATLPMHPRTVA
jgi:hypothetical protein